MKFLKISAGALLWTCSSYLFAYYAHVAPEGAYQDLGSSFEFISCLFMFAYFIGVPILTILWVRK